VDSSDNDDNNNSMSGPPSPNSNNTDRPPQKNMGPADTSSSAFAGGSLEYAAPEILRIAEATKDGGAHTVRKVVSTAVDIWAFGVCVYCMVVGSRPFSNAFQPRVVMAILAGDWDRQRLSEKGGVEVLDLVEGCLEMEERARWDVGEVLGSLWLRGVGEEEEGAEERANGGGGGWRL